MVKIKYKEHYLTLKNYKEPLIEVKDGYGYYGALLSTTDGKLLQCHLCGRLYSELSAHIRQAHEITIPEYRKQYQLAASTALISEEERNKRKMRTLRWLKTLSPEEKEAYKKRAIERWKEWRGKQGKKKQPKLTLETKNKRGTCPDQLLAKVKEVKEKLGRVPSKYDFIGETGSQRYVHLIYKTFGSWSKALKILGYKERSASHGKGGKRKYDDEELLEYLRIFAQEFNKVPTFTDFRRGLLPYYNVYLKRFGSIETARQMAGVYDFIDGYDGKKT